ncbi:MAG: septal ring lytic transglycosylase RlpA family protein [Micavibrio aeruginosavorus]|uniref:Probable endolytic peptidoglycan transglycosylase RlpA n=1 Tax=Micavibrio aeruginosavorus TaxID=349221 RepID=A0A2W5MXE5_9BACT|nr:MAG: septal ring lytic transglycosylase RlpA family protein [Micavibrio aeruginosavorus]
MKIFSLIAALFSVLLLTACAETQFGANLAKNVTRDNRSQGGYKVGNPYLIDGQEYYPQENFNYSETGIASWYGPGFHSKSTANGEQYDQNELTAAHRTLQMPSLVRVTNLENGRSVVVRVNDRGPYARGRIIDVSSKAAELLAMKGKGTAKVRVETLPAESRRIAEDARAGKDTRGYEIALNGNPRPAQPNMPVTLYPTPTAIAVQTTAPEDTMGATQVASVEAVPLEPSRLAPVQGHIANDGRFMPNPVVTQQPVVASSSNIFVQAGAFSDQANAQKLATRLTSYGNAKVYPTTVNGRSFYRVRLGPFAAVPQADAALNQVLLGGVNNALIVVD